MKEFKGGTLKDLLGGPEKEADETRVQEHKKSDRLQRQLRKKKEKRKKDARIRENLPELLEIFLKICDGLEYAHSRGVIHRDLKPFNIAVGEFGEVMILDWGIAKRIRDPELSGREMDSGRDGAPGLTMDGAMMGTPGYMAPEQARGERADERSDIHGMGAILYEMLCSEPPFAGPVNKRLFLTLNKDPVPAHEMGPEVPEELSAIAQKALSKDPRDRYQSAKELREEIGSYLRGYRVRAKKYTPLESLQKWSRRNQAALVASAVVFFGLVITLLSLAIQKRHRQNKQIQQYTQRAEKSLKQADLPSQPKNRKRRLSLYLQARRALEKAFGIDDRSLPLRQKLFEVEKKIGALALLEKNYMLSRISYKRCIRLGWKEEGAKLLQGVDTKEKERQKADEKRIEKIMAILAGGPPPPGMMEEYVMEMVRMNAPYVTKKLIPRVLDPHLWVRMAAIEALGKLGDRTTRWGKSGTVEALMERLKPLDPQKNFLEAEALIWALGRLRDGGADEVVYQVRDKLGWDSNLWERTCIPYSWIPIKKEKKKKKKKTFQYWLKMGEKLYLKGKYKESLIALTKSLRLNPQYAKAYNKRGNVYIALKSYDLAIADYTQAIKINPQYAKAYNNRGNVYHALKSYDLAIADYTQAIKINPQFAKAYNNRGVAYEALKSYDLAIADYTQAIKINPQHAKAYYNRGVTFYFLKNYRKAIGDFNKLLQLNPHHPQASGIRQILRQLEGK